MGLGFAPMVTKTSGTLGQPTPDGDLSGGGAMLEVLLGGTPARGFVLGGGLIAHGWTRPSYDADGAVTRLDDTELSLTFVALFAQLYFDATRGFYVQGLLGAAEETYKYEENGDTKEADLGGIGFGLGVGYDFWVGDQWSLGPELRFSHARVARDEESIETRHQTTTLSLSFTATLH
jgi:hypothetical protein